jgi:hypothetical protein
MVQNPRKAIYIARNGQLVLYLDTPTCPYSATAAAAAATTTGTGTGAAASVGALLLLLLLLAGTLLVPRQPGVTKQNEHMQRLL